MVSEKSAVGAGLRPAPTEQHQKNNLPLYYSKVIQGFVRKPASLKGEMHLVKNGVFLLLVLNIRDTMHNYCFFFNSQNCN